MEADFPRKLGLKAGQRVCLINAPKGFYEDLAQAAPQADVSFGLASETADVVVAWPEGSLANLLRQLRAAIKPNGTVWIVIPKKAKRPPQPSFAAVLEVALPLGLVDNKTLSFSEREYGIRFSIRRELREAP